MILDYTNLVFLHRLISFHKIYIEISLDGNFFISCFSYCVYVSCDYTCLVSYNAVPLQHSQFLQDPYKRHPIARPWGWGMGCLLWVQSLIYVLLLSLQCCIISWHIGLRYNGTLLYFYVRYYVSIFIRFFLTHSKIKTHWCCHQNGHN